MSFPSFTSYPLWLNALVFLLSAGIIWWAGIRLERYAATVSEQTGLGQAFTGMLLLAVATSLPEVATTVTAIIFLNNPTLAVHNLLGGSESGEERNKKSVVARADKKRPH
jgi:cation:H+ antiporter